MSNFRLTDYARKGHGLGNAWMKYYNPLRVFATVESYLKPLTLFFLFLSDRRVGLMDIEKIAPLEEGALPYNLAEVQRQVQNMKTC